MEEQTLFSKKELARVETEEERKHLIECAKDESKIDMKYFEIMKNRCGKGSKSTYGISCSKEQALQIQIEYEFYCALWKEEVEFFMNAFIQKHQIFAIKNDDEVGSDDEVMSKEELMRMMSMMAGMQDKSIRPMIEG